MSDKTKFPAAMARSVADSLVQWLADACLPGRCVVAGSLRRGRPEVGDIEILYIPRVEIAPVEGRLFAEPVNLVEQRLAGALEGGWLQKRINRAGFETWGDQIKLARHVESGVPVDFFTATAENWSNYLVCRTGPRESNEAIARAAQARGLKWKPYTAGFCWADDPNEHVVQRVFGERGVFEIVGLPFLPPHKR